MLDAAEELFAERGYAAVTVRAIAERAGVSHALVHRYLGGKAELYRAVLRRNEDAILNAAPDDPDILASASLMLRAALTTHRQYIRLIVNSALRGLPYDRSIGKFAATGRLVELAERAFASATADERAQRDIDPRLVVAAAVALLLGWVATESWLRPAAGIGDLTEAEVEEGLERLILALFRENLPGIDGGDSTAG